MEDGTRIHKTEWNNPIARQVPHRTGYRPHTLTFNWPEHVTWSSPRSMMQESIVLFRGGMAGMGMCNMPTEEKTHHCKQYYNLTQALQRLKCFFICFSQ